MSGRDGWQTGNSNTGKILNKQNDNR